MADPVMTKGSGDARTQPLFFLLTTAGTDRNSVCFEQHQKAVDILEGRKNDPTFYPVIYGASDEDDWTSEDVWYKANSSLGYITAFVLIFPPRNDAEKYIILSYFWIPEDNMRLRIRRDYVPYDVWATEGCLKTMEGNVLHYGFIEQFINEFGKSFLLKRLRLTDGEQYRWCRILKE